MNSLLRFLEPPVDLERLDRRAYPLSLTGAILGFILHFVWMPTFYYLDVQPLAFINIGSVIIWAIVIYLVRWKADISSAMILIALEILTHQIFAVYYLGWDLGFQYYPVVVMLYIFLGNFKNIYTPILISVMSVISFFTMYYYVQHLRMDHFEIGRLAGEIFFATNSFSVFLTTGIFAFLFNSSVRSMEVELEKEFAQSEALLHSILPNKVAQELRETGRTEPARFDDVTILFSDFKGFTNIAASIPTKKLIGELNDIFSEFDDIMESEGVEKIQTIGDAYLAACGLPTEVDDHAHRCIRAARRMIAYLQQRNTDGAIKWDIRIGIHSGPVSAGVVGKKKFAYNIFGDTINTASRIEAAGEAGKINVSAYTYALVKNEYLGEYRGKISAKGKGDLDMYFID